MHNTVHNQTPYSSEATAKAFDVIPAVGLCLQIKNAHYSGK